MKMETLLPAETKTHAAKHGLAGGKAHIDILRTLFLNGPSIWAYRPVLEAWVDIGALEERPSDTIPGLYERLCAWLPDLVEHRCGTGERGGFLYRLREGTWAGHIIEHVMIELQMQAGIPTGFGRARETSQRGIYRVVVRTPDEKVGLAALHAARDLLIAAIDGDTSGGAFNVEETVLHLRNVALERGLDAGTLCLLGAAAERRLPLMRLNDSGLMQLGYGSRQRRIWMNKVPQGGAIAQSIADDPLLARGLLQSCGIPVPYMALVESAEEAWALRQDREVPLEITPVNADGASVVRQAADTREQIEAAYQAASADDEEVLVQDFVAGNGYRLLVIGNRIATAQCYPASGEPATSVEAEAVHPEVAAMAALAVRVVGLDIAEVRMVANDISLPLSGQNVCVNRVNPMPDLLQYGGKEQDRLHQLGLAMVDHLAAKVEEDSLPIIAVSGSNGRTAVAQLVALLLRDKYKKIGLACADGLYIGARRVESGNQAGRDAAQRVLRNPAIDAAVFEHGWQDIVSEGLGYDRCRIGIVTGWDSQDTLPEYDINNAEQMRKVIRTPIDVVLPDGVAVLNADDPAVASLSGLCDGEVIFFSRDGQASSLSRHRTKGGSAVFMRNKDMVFAVGRHTIAIEMDPAQAHGQSVDNMLAAAAAAWALGVPAAAICNTLKKLNEQLSPVSPTAVIAE